MLSDGEVKTAASEGGAVEKFVERFLGQVGKTHQP